MRESAKHVAEDQLRASVLNELTFLETAVIERFYGLREGHECMTTAAIAAELKVEKSEVRRAKVSGLQKLKASETVKQLRQDIAAPRRRLYA